MEGRQDGSGDGSLGTGTECEDVPVPPEGPPECPHQGQALGTQWTLAGRFFPTSVCSLRYCAKQPCGQWRPPRVITKGLTLHKADLALHCGEI